MYRPPPPFRVVLQDPFLFSGTVFQRASVLRADTITDREVEKRRYDQVNVADFIRTLPGTFSEPVRRSSGVALSGRSKTAHRLRPGAGSSPGSSCSDKLTSSPMCGYPQSPRPLRPGPHDYGPDVCFDRPPPQRTVQANTVNRLFKGQLREQGTPDTLARRRSFITSSTSLPAMNGADAAGDLWHFWRQWWRFYMWSASASI